MEISTLGGLSIVRDGETVEAFASRKAEALLVYLACTRREQPREVLAELLWDDRTQRQAMANLRVVLSSLRKVMGPLVSITRTTAGINGAAVLAVDAAQLDDALAALSERDGGPSPLMVQSLTDALALYRGDFLAGFSIPEAAGFDAWAAAERQRLHRLAVDGWLRLGRWHLEQGAHTETIASATRLLQIDGLAEAGHRQLMEALARAGRRAEALAQYEACRQLLDEELGVEPDAETQALCERIRAGALRAVPLPSEQQSSGDTIPHNLPAASMPFYGREVQLEQLDKLLADPNIRLLTITGVAGAGKTRLAYEAARRQLQEQPHLFDDGIYALSLSPLEEPEQIPVAVAEALGFRLHDPDQGAPPLWRQLAEQLQGKKMLLLLDNFEHLLDGGPALGELLAASKGLQLLLTSRERLRLREEQVFPLDGFNAPDGRGGATIEADPLAQLFLYSARRVRPGFELAPEGMADLDDLRAMTGGLPLAVELAASWVEVLPLREIVAEIRADLDFLQTDLHNVPRRQRSLRAIFEASWRQLVPELRTVFARLSVFRGGFTRSAAREVAGASPRDLATLGAKSLLQYHDEQNRYQLHELLRQFGERKLQEGADEEKSVRQRHAAFYCTLVEQANYTYLKGEAQAALDELEREQTNVRRAWKWATAEREVALLAPGLDMLCLYYSSRGSEVEGGQLLRAATESLSSPSLHPGEDVARRRLLVLLLTWRAVFAGSGDEMDGVLQRADGVLEELRREDIDVRPEEAFWRFRSGLAQSGVDVEVARQHLARSLSLYQQVGNQVLATYAMVALAQLERQVGNYGEGAELTRRAIEGKRAMGNLDGVADALEVLGQIERHRGRLIESAQALREALRVYRRRGDRYRGAESAGALAVTLCWSGEFAEARASAAEGLEWATEVGSEWATAKLLGEAALASLHLGAYERALQQAERSLTLARTTGNQRAEDVALMVLGQVSLVSGTVDEAIVRFEQARAILARRREPLAGLALALKGAALQQVGQAAEARQALVSALRDSQGREFFVALNGLPAAALLLSGIGDVERAAELHALARTYPYVANSRWYADLMGENVAEWERTLPAERVAAVLKRGRAPELWEAVEWLLVELGES